MLTDSGNPAQGLDALHPAQADSDLLVRLRRPDGRETLLRLDGEQLQRVMDLANGEFGDKSIVLGDIPAPRVKG